MTAQEFNSNWMVRVDYQEIHTLLGYFKLVALFDDCASKVFKKLSSCRQDVLVLKPFHGSKFTFYRR